MAGSGKLGDLYLSLDIKSNLSKELSSYTQKIDAFEKRIKELQVSVNDASSDLNKMAKGSDAWEKQRESIRRNIKEIDELYRKWELYNREVDAVQQRAGNVAKGGLVGKGFSITSMLDTKPIEQQITKLEKVVQLQEKLQSIQSQRPGSVMDFLFSDRAGNKNYRAYSAAVETYRNQVTDVTSQLKAIGGENIGIADAKRQLESLYSTLARFEQANQRATSSVRDSRSELDKHAAKQKEVEIAFQGVMAAQRREAQQEAANRANIEATNAARQRQVEVLRQQSEALMRNKLSTLESQRSQMAGLYSRGRAVGLDAAELENIRQRYREISQEILNMQTMLQHAKGLSYNDMFASGRTVGSGGAFIKDAAGQIARVRQETLDATRAARDLASAFNQVHRSASQSSQVLGDIKSMFLQGGIVYGAQRFAMSIITTGGEIEKQHIALQSILGDLQSANELFGQIKNLALESPFTFSELNRDVKQLAAFGVESENLYNKTKRLADISAGLGVSFERLGLAYGQTKARSWLDGKELRQFAYAGLPMLQKLADLYTQTKGRVYTTRDVRDMITKREVPFEDVDKIFDQLTNKGGQFYNMQLVLSETLLGRYLKLKDAWEIMLSDFARGDSIVGGTFKRILDAITAIVQGLDEMGPVIAAAFSGVALRKAATLLGGGVGAGILGAKGRLAAKYQEKALTEQLNASEQRILLTKNRITQEDLKALISTQAITKSELQRLYVTGQISKSIYQQNIALVSAQASTTRLGTSWAVILRYVRMFGMGAVWQTFTSRGMVALSLLGNGIKALGASIWTAIGGLPGLIMTAATMGIAYAWQQHEELKQAQKQALDELADRGKQMKEFLADYDTDKAIARGGQDLENSIDAYKEKLKELAPYNYNAYVMQADEIKSHELRLKYLRGQLELLQEANVIAQKKSSVFVDEFGDDFDKIGKIAQRILSTPSDKYKMVMAISGDDEEFDKEIEKIAEKLANKFQGIARDPKMQEAMKQLRSEIYGQKQWSPDMQMLASVSIDKLLHIDDTGEFNDMVQNKLLEVVNDSQITLENGVVETGAMLVEKIKYGRQLTDAEKKKLDEMSRIAINQLENEYPHFAFKLQSLLNNSKFMANIRLNFVGEKATGIQKQVYGNYPSMTNPNVRNLGLSWLGEEGSVDEAVNKGKQEIDKRLNEWLTLKKMYAKGKATIDQVNTAKGKYDDAVFALSGGYAVDYKGEGKKNNKPKKTTTGTPKDTELDALKKRVELYKKFFSTLRDAKKQYGNEAIDYLKGTGLYDTVFGFGLSNLDDYEGSISKLISTLKVVKPFAQERAEWIASIKEDIGENKIKKEAESIELYNKELSAQLDLLSDQYETYKKIYDLTGNSTGASSVAFGGVSMGATYKAYLESRMASILGKNSKYAASEVMGMSKDDFNKTFGSDNHKGLAELYNRWHENEKNIRKESLDLMLDVIKNHRTLDQQIADENREYERQLLLISEIKDATLRSEAKRGLDESHSETVSKLQLEKFKKESDWVTVFDNLDRVSTGTIKSMMALIEKESKNTGLRPEDIKTLRDALEKLNEKLAERSPLSVMKTSLSQGNAIRSFINDVWQKSYAESNRDAAGNPVYNVTDVDAGKMGITAGQYTLNQMMNLLSSSEMDFTNSIQGLSTQFKACADILSPVIDLFEALGETNLADIVGVGQNALGSAANTAGAFSTLSKSFGEDSAIGSALGSAGPYGAAAAAALSVATSIFALHDKALQKEIEASQQRQKEMEDLSKNVETQLNRTLGGIYNFRASKSTESLLKDYLGKYMIANNGRNDFASYIIGKQYSYIQKTTANAIKEALSQGGNFYDTTYASMLAQRDELVRQQQLEEDKKKTDSSKVADYKQQILELQDQIDYFAEDMAKKLYDIDIQSWAKDLSDAVVEAWENGENAADAYGEKIKEILNNTFKSIIAKSIMEDELKDTLEYVKTEMSKKNGLLDADTIKSLSSMLNKASETAVSNITHLLDQMKKDGYDFSPTSSKSLSSGIKSITEDSADILASYVNAIRLDVSVDRANIQLIADAASKLPTMSVIAKSQLTALESISQNTLRNADAADQMLSLFKAITNGTKKVYMN